jgi:pimeloyl-ACP methyl ester carboxylesterase
MQRNIFYYSRTVLINYEVDGAGCIPVVFIHGFAASLVTWHDIVKLFPKGLFRLYLLDLKGFGFSSKPREGNYSIADQADIVLAFIKAHGLRNAILIGHSLGGSVALQAALKSGQDRDGRPLGRLILLDCAAYPQRMPLMMRILRWPLLAVVLMRLFPSRLIVWYTLTRIFRNRKAVTASRIRRYTNGFSRRGISYVLVSTVRHLGTFESEFSYDYRRIKIPTLIIWGREDHITELWQAHRLHLEIEGSRLEILDGSGHNPHEEYPGKTFSVIREFIGG